MRSKIKARKLHTQYSLQWSLKVGDHLGTLNRGTAIKLVNVKPVIFYRWISGKLVAPANKLERIKCHAFATANKQYRKVTYRKPRTEWNEEMIRARFLWKSMIFDQLSMVGKRRFCDGVKKIYR